MSNKENNRDNTQYLTIKEEKAIARENKKIMTQFEREKNRKNVDESE